MKMNILHADKLKKQSTSSANRLIINKTIKELIENRDSIAIIKNHFEMSYEEVVSFYLRLVFQPSKGTARMLIRLQGSKVSDL